MRLYNTYSQQLETLQPILSNEVSIYTCGPTVYDYAHVGNWFTFIRYDLLIRTLVALGYKPNWVLNITDVGHLTSDQDEGEDKLAKKALKENKTAWDIANYYSEYFTNSLAKLNFTMPRAMPRATESINEQIEFIKELESKGFTYKINDGIYFDTSKFDRYTDFARLDLEEQQGGKRIEYNTEKRQPADFALWKFSPSDVKRDMEWPSPWGIGFPGWHIECSAMCLKYLGKTIDIHCGGIDHIPVHHTNEIAQSESANNKPLANIWLHSNHVLINDQKISKSLNNTITIEDIERHDIPLEAFRLHVIESHYRSQSKFSWDALEASKNRLLRFKNFAVKRFQPSQEVKHIEKPKLLEAMSNDLNTPKALSLLEDYINQSDKFNLPSQDIKEVLNLVDNLFGLKLIDTPDITDAQKELINKRTHARNNQDWALSDDIRDLLNQQNIGLKDNAKDSTWLYLA